MLVKCAMHIVRLSSRRRNFAAHVDHDWDGIWPMTRRLTMLPRVSRGVGSLNQSVYVYSARSVLPRAVPLRSVLVALSIP